MTKSSVLVVAEGAEYERLHRLLEAEPDIQLVGRPIPATEALAQVRRSTPSVVLLRMADRDPADFGAIADIHEEWPAVRILPLAEAPAFDDILLAMALGASGWASPLIARDHLLVGLDAIAAGGAYIDPALAGRLVTGCVERAKHGQPRPAD